MMNGMMFGGEGPVMQGTWYNPNTGDVFTVRDSFFEDNNYVVTTTDGRYMNYNQLQNYIQSDTPAEELKAMLNKNKTEVKEEIPAEIKGMLALDDDNTYDSYMIPDDDIYTNTLSKPLGNITNAPNTVYQPAPTPVNVNRTIIEKALKNTTGPKLTIIADWDNYPEKEISMLTDIMDIPIEEILEWYCNGLDVNWILEDVKNSIKAKIIGVPTPIIDELESQINTKAFSGVITTVNDKTSEEVSTQTSTIIEDKPKSKKTTKKKQ